MGYGSGEAVSNAAASVIGVGAAAAAGTAPSAGQTIKRTSTVRPTMPLRVRVTMVRIRFSSQSLAYALPTPMTYEPSSPVSSVVPRTQVSKVLLGISI